MKSTSVGIASTQRLVLIYKDENNCAIFWTAREAQTFLDNAPIVYADDGSIEFPKGRSLITPKYWNYRADIADAALRADEAFAAEINLARVEGRNEKSVMKPAALESLSPLKVNRLDQSSLWAEVHSFDSEPSSIRSNVLHIRSEYGPKLPKLSNVQRGTLAISIAHTVRELSENIGAALPDDAGPKLPGHPIVGVPPAALVPALV